MDEKCVWKSEDSYDEMIFETTCGNSFVFYDGGPGDNKFIYCPYCGKMIDDQSNENDHGRYIVDPNSSLQAEIEELNEKIERLEASNHDLFQKSGGDELDWPDW